MKILKTETMQSQGVHKVVVHAKIAGQEMRVAFDTDKTEKEVIKELENLEKSVEQEKEVAKEAEKAEKEAKKAEKLKEKLNKRI